MTLEEYAKENWAEYLKPISELSRSKKMDDKSAIVSLETRAYDFDAIVKDKFQSTDYTTPKSADCMLIQGNQICFIEFKRFPCPKKKFEITLPDGVDLPEQLCSDIVESNTTTKSQNRQIKKLTNRDIHNSLKLKIVDSQVLALHDFVQLLQESVPADLSAIFIIVVDNASEDFMVNFLLENKKRTQTEKDEEKKELHNKIDNIKMHTRRYHKNFLPCGIYHSIKVWIPFEFKQKFDTLWDLFSDAVAK